MSYDNPLTLTHTIGEHDFGSGDEALAIKGPAGMRGTVRDVIVGATEGFTADTTEAKVQLGDSSDGTKFANVGLGTLADTDAYSATQQSPDELPDQYIPADTQVEVTLVAPTGGTPAGKGHVWIVIDWW